VRVQKEEAFLICIIPFCIGWICMIEWRLNIRSQKPSHQRERVLLPAPLRFSSCTPQFSKSRNSSWSFIWKRTPWLLEIGIWECAMDSSIQNFFKWGVFQKQILYKLLISRLLNLEAYSVMDWWIWNAYFCYGWWIRNAFFEWWIF